MESLTVAAYPSAEGRREGSRVRLPRKENTRSRHQRLFEEKCRKNRKRCGLRTLSMKGSGVVFTHEEGISTPRIHHKGQQPLMKCANMTSIFFISLLLFYSYTVFF